MSTLMSNRNLLGRTTIQRAIFVSGRGSNFCRAWTEDSGQLRDLVTDQEKSTAGPRALRRGMKIYTIPKTGISEVKNLDWEQALNFLSSRKINQAFLLGFMRIVPSSLITALPARIFNLHPSLLPKFPGLKSILRAWQEKEAIGVSFHRVVLAVDAGKVLAQRTTFKAAIKVELAVAEFLVHVDEQRVVGRYSQKLERIPQA